MKAGARITAFHRKCFRPSTIADYHKILNNFFPRNSKSAGVLTLLIAC